VSDRATIEFWKVAGDGTVEGLLEAIVSDAAPPRKGEIINIRKTDYHVVRVDYSLDRPTHGPKTLRRNVMLAEGAE
tara:strand:+ start:79 stop:306 length:228 start_codon:yes stop_codon:yes gene_type:complete